MPNEPTLKELQALHAQITAERGRYLAKIAVAEEAVSDIALNITKARKRGDARSVMRFEWAQATATTDLVNLHNQLKDFDRRRPLPDLGRFLDPCRVESQTPLLLLPVRLETQFSDDGTQLHIRMYPDKVHIDDLNRSISDEEKALGQTYWQAIWTADEDAREAAWVTLCRQISAERAVWVSHALEPTNIAERAAGTAPVFPDLGANVTTGQAARLLPDCFAVALWQGDKVARAQGRPIVDPLPTGLLDFTAASLDIVDGLPVAPGVDWLVSYDAAVAAGMAITIALPKAKTRVDRLYVYGVDRRHNGREGAEALSDVLRAHSANDGVGFVAQGSASNNMETGNTLWSSRAAPRPVEIATAAAAGSNAALLADALGIDSRLLSDGPGANDRERERASAMNRALWPATWGSFLDKMDGMGGVELSSYEMDNARRLHADAVYGRGSLPIMRIGDQPYGVVAVGASDREWKLDGFDGRLLDLLRRVRGEWRAALRNVLRIKPDTATQSETLLKLLGIDAVSRSVDARGAVSQPTCALYEEVTGKIDSEYEVELLIGGLAWEVLHGASRQNPISLEDEARPIRLPLAHESDAIFCRKLLNGENVGALNSVFQALVQLGWEDVKRSVAVNSGHGQLVAIIDLSKLPRELGQRTYEVAQEIDSITPDDMHLLAAQYANLAPTVSVRRRASSSQAKEPRQLRQSVAQLTLEASTPEARREFAFEAVQLWVDSMGAYADMRHGLGILADDTISLNERRLLVGETLDIASHRLDAWITALVERRRRAQRAAKPAETRLGAYGWVENIVPMNLNRNQKAATEGYIHAPSPAQAATAGVLRAAYRAHNGEAFAVDLSSARVRAAMDVIEGVQQGQSLAALLGYHIERTIHEDPQGDLDAYILSLRMAAPLVRDRLTDRDDGDLLAQEAIAPSNVVDGLRVIEMWTGADKEKLITAIRQKPAFNTYIHNWIEPSGTTIGRIGAHIENGAVLLDAVADLMLVESVHQMTQGNMERASAAADAASTGDSPVPTPMVIQTPRSGPVVTHRLMVIAGGTGWAPDRPRAKAAPEIEGWAAQLLGDPAKIILHADEGPLYSFADTGLCALDLVYGASEATGLTALLVHRLGLPDATILNAQPAADWPSDAIAFSDVVTVAVAMRELLARAKIAEAQDLALDAEGLRSVGTASLQASYHRIEAIAQDFGDAIAALAAALDTPDALEAALFGLHAFGVVAPAQGDRRSVAEIALRTAKQRLDKVTALLASPRDADQLPRIGQALFGDGFWVTAPFDAPAAPDAWDTAMAATPDDANPVTIRRWIADAAWVQQGYARYAELLLLTQAVGRSRSPQVAQLVDETGHAVSQWVSEPMALRLDAPASEWVVDAASSYAPGTPLVALVIDQFVERLSSPSEQVYDAEDQPSDIIPAMHTSGVAMHARAASSRPPQALLMPVAPDDQPWTRERIEAVLDDTLELLKLRCVRLEDTAIAAQILPAIYTQSWSLQGEKVLNFGEFLKYSVSESLQLYLGRQQSWEGV